MDWPAAAALRHDLVVDVGDVHDVTQRHSLQLEKAPQNVDMNKRAEVADVAVVVHRGPAGVHAERLSGLRLQLLDLSAERVIEAK